MCDSCSKRRRRQVNNLVRHFRRAQILAKRGADPWEGKKSKIQPRAPRPVMTAARATSQHVPYDARFAPCSVGPLHDRAFPWG